MARSTNQRSWGRRLFAPANVISVLAGLLVFIVGSAAWPTNLGALFSAVAAAITTGLVWFIWWRTTSPDDLDSVVAVRRLGAIPDDPSGRPAPTIDDPASTTSAAYRAAYADLEAHTNGRVVLVASPSPGQGSTTVALNLAVSATQQGRRVLLVDGDTGGRGLSRFMGSGSVPGLTDLAAERATMQEAARLWKVAPNTVLPVLPSGTPPADEPSTLEGPGLGAAFDVVGEKADLVLIDGPPVLWNGSIDALAPHADGAVLVVTEAAPRTAIVDTKDRLAAAGAPVIGYVLNRSKGKRSWWMWPPVRVLKRSLTAFVLIVLGFTAYTGAQLWNSWQSVETTAFDTEQAAALPTIALEEVAPEIEDEAIVVEELEEVVLAPPAPEGAYRSFLLIGGDNAADLADVIMLLVLPADGSDPFMVSLPRDLYLPNRCTNGYSRINTTIHGCGEEINGPTLLSLTIKDFTGIEVDNFALFDFEGFAKIIDGVGGIEICVENAVRDDRAHLSLPAGCTMASGEQALSWVRSRHTQENVNGRWRSVPGAGDLLRNRHQQEVILELFGRLKSFGSPSDLTTKVAELSDAFVLDDRLGITDAIALAWAVRDLDLHSIRRLSIPVRLTTTKTGQSVLVPTVSFADLLSEAYPDLLDADEEPPTAGAESPANR